MPANNITVVTVTFGNGVKREEYGPLKKAEVTIVANVGEGEDGSAALDEISNMALAKVAALLSAPKPETVITEIKSEPEVAASGEAPARRTRGPNKVKPAETPTTDEQPQEPTPSEEAQQPAEDEWAAGAEDIVVTDAELLAATSKRAGELGAREPILKLIATFASRTDGAPFKVQEIPANQRKDYLDKLTKLAA